MEFRLWLEGDRELASMYKSKLGGVQQDIEHHPEGDVLAHSRLVRGAIKQAALTLGSYTGELGAVLSDIDFNLNIQELEILALAAWGHDIGKVTATGVENGRIHARGHQDRDHFEPQLADLGMVASEKTRQLYLRNKDLVDFLILHHMDFASGSFGRAFVAENFSGGRVKNTLRMKLLLILMWADKLGRGRVSLGSHERGLLKSASMAAIRAGNIAKQSGPFVGDAASMVKMLRDRGQDDSVIRRSLANKYGLSAEEISSLLSEKTLYHGTIADYEGSIRQYGLQGGWHGPLGSFVSQHYDSEEYGEPSEEDEVVFATDKAELGKAVNAMVHHIGQKLKKDFHSVSDNDIRNYGLLVIIKDGSDAATQYSNDDRRWAYENPPRGAEEGDYFASSLGGDVYLRGSGLIRFLKRNGEWPRHWGSGSAVEREKYYRGRLGAMAISRGHEKSGALEKVSKAPLDTIRDQLRKWKG